MKKTIYMLLAIVAIAMSSCYKSSAILEENMEDQGVIIGNVKYDGSLKDGVLVELYVESDTTGMHVPAGPYCYVKSTKTDASGEFKFTLGLAKNQAKNVKVKSYWEGGNNKKLYYHGEKTGTVSAGSAVKLEIAVSKTEQTLK